MPESAVSIFARGARAIGKFGVAEYGEPLFVPAAVPAREASESLTIPTKRPLIRTTF
jgi:hypothetical protein